MCTDYVLSMIHFIEMCIFNEKYSGRYRYKSTCLVTISRGNFIYAWYCTFIYRPNKYNSVCWTSSNFLWAPTNTIFFNFPTKFYYCQKRQNSVRLYFIGKITCVIRQVIKTTYNISLWLPGFVSVWKRIFRLVPRKFGHFRSFSHFEAAITRKPLENQGNRNDVLYVVFYKLSDDTSYNSLFLTIQ